MYTVVFHRYGEVLFEKAETKAEAHEEFDFINDFEIGFPEFILNESNVIIRDGIGDTLLSRKRSVLGKLYDLESKKVLN